MEGRTLFLQEKWPLSECQGFEMKILLTSLGRWMDGGKSNKISGPKRDDRVLDVAGIKLAREKLGSRCLFIQGFSSV